MPTVAISWVSGHGRECRSSTGYFRKAEISVTAPQLPIATADRHWAPHLAPLAPKQPYRVPVVAQYPSPALAASCTETPPRFGTRGSQFVRKFSQKLVFPHIRAIKPRAGEYDRFSVGRFEGVLWALALDWLTVQITYGAAR
jgi:hypothetical protein